MAFKGNKEKTMPQSKKFTVRFEREVFSEKFVEVYADTLEDAIKRATAIYGKDGGINGFTTYDTQTNVHVA